MAHIQRRCLGCRRTVPQGKRACPNCASKEGKYVARVRAPSGIEISRSFERRIDAETWITAQESAKLRGAFVNPSDGKVRLADFGDRWLKGAATLAPSTLHRYESLWRCHIRRVLGDTPLSSIRQSDIRAFIADLESRGLAPKTQRHAYALLMELLRDAAADQLIAGVPEPKRSQRRRWLPKVPVTEIRCLPADELWTLSGAMDERYQALVLLAGWTGLRWSEIAGLTVGRLRLLERRMDITRTLVEVNGRLVESPGKTGPGSVRFPAALADVLGEHLSKYPAGPEGLVFSSPAGGAVRYSNFYRRQWIPALKTAGLGEWVGTGQDREFKPAISPHDLRHTAVALAIASGAHPKAIQEMCRHSSIKTTMDVYGHLFPSLQDDLAERLDGAFRAAVDAATAGPLRDEREGAPVAKLA